MTERLDGTTKRIDSPTMKPVDSMAVRADPT
jgi:hypothetical protein